MPEREFKGIDVNKKAASRPPQGTMAQSGRTDSVSVVFQCDVRGSYVRKGIYIAGNQDQLGNWKPNTVIMYDDGTGMETGSRKTASGRLNFGSRSARRSNINLPTAVRTANGTRAKNFQAATEKCSSMVRSKGSSSQTRSERCDILMKCRS